MREYSPHIILIIYDISGFSAKNLEGQVSIVSFPVEGYIVVAAVVLSRPHIRLPLNSQVSSNMPPKVVGLLG